MESIRDYYLNALLAQAAYGDLNGIDLNNSETVINSLQVDTNGDPNLTDTLANYVWDNYTILDHYPNDAVGFSATVFKHKETHEITIAFRGTELNSDTVNDVLNADIYGIVKNGSAEEQIVSAYNYYLQLITPVGQSVLQLSLHVDTQLPPNTVPFVTESIGGETIYSWIEQTTVVNSGDHAGKLVGENSASITSTGHSLGGHLATAFNRLFYGAVAETYTYNGPGFGGARVDAFFGELPGAAANFNSGEIVNVSGTGLDAIAGFNNMYGEELDIFIEELSTPETFKEHSSSSILDSLAVIELLHTLDRTLSLAQYQIILESSSNVFVDSLEGVVDGLGKLFVGVGYIDTSIGDFTMQDRRESLHANIQTIKDRLTLDGNGYANLTLSIVSASSIADLATPNTEAGRGYRYSLVNLLPFAITSNLTGTAADDPQYDAANFSKSYLADRAQMLKLVLKRNITDDTTSNSLDENLPDALYIDQKTNLKLTTGDITLAGVKDSTNRIYFGDEADNVTVIGVESHNGKDRLYGMGGNDILHGGEGSDHIEGNLGNDELHGDEDNDYLYGGAGADKLYGGSGNDTLSGGDDQEADTYYYSLGDGTDTIIDADLGGDRIMVDLGQGYADLASLTFKQVSAGSDTYVANGYDNDPDNDITLIVGGALSGTASQLNIGKGQNSGSIILLEYGNGGFGINLQAPEPEEPPPVGIAQQTILSDADIDAISGSPDPELYGFRDPGSDRWESYYSRYESSYPDVEEQVTLNTTFPFHLEVWLGAGDSYFESNDQNVFVSDDVGRTQEDNVIRSGVAGGLSYSGDDVIKTGLGEDIIFVGGGTDEVKAGGGNDLLVGVSDGDWLAIAGNESVDRLFGEDGDDYIIGGAGDDLLSGGADNDKIYGGLGNDTILGGDGWDIIDGDSKFDPDNSVYQITSATTATVTVAVTDDQVKFGTDIIRGGAGNDEIRGGGGNDFIYGDGDNDKLYGDSDAIPVAMHGDDYLSGGLGDDEIVGFGGNDVIDGGDGNDLIFGDANLEDIHITGDDVIRGGAGDDTIYGRGGNDEIWGGDDNDSISGGTGEDVIHGDLGDDHLYGDENNDQLYGDDGSDDIYGGDGDDILQGDDGNDNLFGDGGNDTLIGGAGNDGLVGDDGDDTLIGGAGNDSLGGGLGNDTYIVRKGDGFSYIEDNQGSSTLSIDSDAQELILSQDGSYLYIRYSSDRNDLIIIDNGSVSNISALVLSDGASYVLSELTINQITEYSPNDGDLVIDVETVSNGTGDIGISLVEGVAEENLVFTRVGDALELSFQNLGPDLSGGWWSVVTINNYYSENNTSASNTSIVGVRFTIKGTPTGETGTPSIINSNDIYSVMTKGTSGDDTLYGSDGSDVIEGFEGDDYLKGYSGNDTLIGGKGNDFIDMYYEGLYSPGQNTLIFSKGDGHDFVSVGPTLVELNDTHIVFDDTYAISGISFANVYTGTYTEVGYHIFYGDNFADAVRMDFNGISTIALADGTVISGVDLVGTNGLDQISGTKGNDTIRTGGGPDTIIAGEGDDVIIVGYDEALIDTEWSSNTNNVYLDIHSGLGNDVIDLSKANGDWASLHADDDTIILGNGTWEIKGTNNIIQFIDGITPDDFTAVDGSSSFALYQNTPYGSEYGYHLIQENQDHWFGNDMHDALVNRLSFDNLGTGKIVFSDGTVWTQADVDAFVLPNDYFAPIGESTFDIVNLVLNESWQATAGQLIAEAGINTYSGNQYLNDVYWDEFDPNTPSGFAGTLDYQRSSGSVEISPNQDFTGDIRVRYWITDEYGLGQLQSIKLHWGKTAPGHDTITVTEDTAIVFSLQDLMANDSFIGSYDQYQLVINDTTNGALNYDAATETFTYTPQQDYFYDDDFRYGFSDGTTTGWATVTLDITPVNDVPFATNDQVNAVENMPLFITVSDLLANDNDVDGDSLAIVSVGNALGGIVQLDVNSGQIVFTPEADYYGPASFEYALSDGSLTSLATVGVDVRIDQSLPNTSIGGDVVDDVLNGNSLDERLYSRGGNDTITGSGGDDLLVGGLGNDYLEGGLGSDTYRFIKGHGQDVINNLDTDDASVDTLSFVEVDFDEVRIKQTSSDLLLEIPDTGDSVTIEAFFSKGGKSDNLLDVIRFNDGSSWSSDDIKAFVSLDSEGNYELLGDGGDDVLQGLGGDDILTGNAGGDTLNGGAGSDLLEGGLGDDVLSGGAGSDVYRFSLGDGHDTIDNADVSPNRTDIIDFVDVNPADVQLLRESNDSLLIAIAGGDSIYVLEYFDGSGVTESAVDQIRFADGTTWTVDDAIALTVPNEIPVAQGDTASTNEDASLIVDVATLLSNDVDADGDILSVTSVNNAINGTVDFDEVSQQIQFNPDSNFNGIAYFDYIVTDGIATDSSTVTIDVAAVNDAPEATPDSVSANVDTAISISLTDLLVNDADIDGDLLAVLSVQNATNGSAVLNTSTGNVDFTPNPGYTGQASFEYTVTDGALSTSTSVVIDVSPVNNAPEANADTLSAIEGTALIINIADLITNDTDSDGDALTILSINNVVNGTAIQDSGAGTITFTPHPYYTGPAAFDYQLSDGELESTGNVSIDVAIDTQIAGYIEGTSGDDTLNGNNGENRLYGMAGNDNIDGLRGNDRLNGGVGNDTLAGGWGDDTYVFTESSGIDTIDNSSSKAQDTDSLWFAGDFQEADLWFSENANDLLIDVIGTDDQVIIQGWYSNTVNEIEEIHVNDAVLINSQVDQLVQAMAAISATEPANLGDLTAQQQDDLNTAIAAAWQ